MLPGGPRDPGAPAPRRLGRRPSRTRATRAAARARTPEPEAPSTSPGSPTQAGLPIFDDENDDVSWLRARDEPAPPPPPFEEPPERPLFASEARRPRFPRPDDGPGDGPRRRVLALRRGPSSSSGAIPAVDDARRRPRPGARPQLDAAGHAGRRRCWCCSSRSRSRSTSGAARPRWAPSPTPRAEHLAHPHRADPEAAPAPFTGLVADDLDPQGDGEENPDEVAGRRRRRPGHGVDHPDLQAAARAGRPQERGRPGRRPRAGPRPSAGRPRASSGKPTGYSLYLSDAVPTNPSSSRRSPRAGPARPRRRAELADAPTGRYLTVWLTSLPSVRGGFQGGIVDLVVSG